ncbi:histidine kinase [Nonomuraea sp. NPDC050328]|uniref:histidine kinase n=1 Tax=Nonomuraea sp. NPDC050328 TaxID=3364361 RepID=UPI0037B8EEE9
MEKLARLVAFAVLSVVIAAVYFGLGALSVDGLLAALVAGAIFHPLRLRLQDLADRLLRVERDPYRLVDRLAQGVQRAGDPGEALAAGASTVRQALRAGGVAVEVAGTTTLTDGELGADRFETALVWHGRPVGRLVVSAESPDPALMEMLARHLAEVAHAVQLTGDLRQARERLLATREEERARLMSVLRDGLGATLVSLREQLRNTPGADGLARARERLAEAVAEVRDLVYGLHASTPGLEDERRPAHRADPEPWRPVSPRRRLVVTLAWAGGVLSPAAVLASVWLAADSDYSGWLQPIDPIGMLYPLAGAFLIHYRPRLLVPWLLWGTGVSWALYEYCHLLAHWLYKVDPGNPLFVPAAWVSIWLWMVPLSIMSGYLPLFFPDARLPSRRWRPLVVAVTVLFVGHSTLMAVMPDPEPEIGLPLDNPLGIEALGELPWLVETYIGWVMVPVFTLSVVSLIFRYRSAGTRVQRQIAWYIGSMAVYMAWWILRLPLGEDMDHPAVVAVQMTLSGGIPLAIVAAVLRRGFYGIRIVVNRTLVYVTLAALLGFGYLVLIWAGNQLAEGFGPLAGLVAAMAVAVLFHPVRLRLQGSVDRLMDVERDPYRAVDRLSRTVQEAGDPAEALASATAVLRWALGARGAGVEVDGELFVDGALGDRPRTVELSWHGEPVGRLLLSGPRQYGQQLQVLARHLAELAHAVRLAEDLRRSRERIRATREQERRRLARELHDGLGPVLTGVILTLDAARRDPDQAAGLLARVDADLGTTVVSVRELVAGLRPAVLDDLGLAGALREAASLPGVRVELEVEPGAIPPPVELAAYRIVLEALTNVRRHARAGWACARVLREGAALRVEVLDDGIGLAEGVTAGVGLTSMHERAAEVGGTCHVAARPGGGTSVAAFLPLQAESGAEAGAESGAEAGVEAGSAGGPASGALQAEAGSAAGPL